MRPPFQHFVLRLHIFLCKYNTASKERNCIFTHTTSVYILIYFVCLHIKCEYDITVTWRFLLMIILSLLMYSVEDQFVDLDISG